MSESIVNAYSVSHTLSTNAGATAAAIEIIASACSAGDESSKVGLLEWVIDGDNFQALADKIKQSAS